MKILCVHGGLAPAFRRLGHEVRSVSPGPGVVDARTLLASPDAVPDLLFQQESLGHRTFLSHLADVPCLKAFWALDAHLNIHWHKYYTRLFDAVFTPHVSLFRHMPPEWTPQRLYPLAMYGYAAPWRPHAERSRELAFVGRNDAHTRPLRSRFLRLLAPLGLTPSSGLDQGALRALYSDTRMAPNESIAFEVNYRLMEAASAGACVLAPPVGDDQDRLYTPDREMLVYEHSLDLLEKIAFLRRRPALAEKLGRAAWEATASRHLPDHRARSVLEKLPSGSASGPGRTVALAMSLAQRGRHIRQPAPAFLLRHLEQAAEGGDAEASALRLRCLSEAHPGEETERSIRIALTRPLQPGEDEIALAALGHALLREDLPLFRAFWGRLHAASPGGRPERPASLYQAGLLLASELQTRGRLFQPGMDCGSGDLTPETALEALYLARRHAGEDLEWARRLHLLTARAKSMTLARHEALAVLHAAAPGWRVRLEYGCSLLDIHDPKAALPILRQALTEAEAEGRGTLAGALLQSRHVDPLVAHITYSPDFKEQRV